MEAQHPTLAHGKICYLMVPAADVEASADFYQKVFNWNIRRRDGGVVSFDDGVGEVSGMFATNREPETDPHVLIYIMVDDIEVSMSAITNNGGKITQPVGMDAPEITAQFSDPAGNVFGLYQERSLETK